MLGVSVSARRCIVLAVSVSARRCVMLAVSVSAKRCIVLAVSVSARRCVVLAVLASGGVHHLLSALRGVLGRSSAPALVRSRLCERQCAVCAGCD